jgi:MFS family permease
MRQLAAQKYPARSAAWALVATLFLASVLNTIDRSMLNFLVDPVRRDLHISDVQVSLLQGLSFSLFYVSAGFPLGLIADRTSRIRLLLIGSAVWSAATIAAGLAPTYGWMFAARMLVGFGEATLGPCAMPLISDTFPAERRGRPISLHLLGGSIASGLAAWLIGFIFMQAPRGTFDFIPGLAGAAPWRIAFIAAGAAGFILVAALALQREPERRGVAVNGGEKMRLTPILAFLRSHWPVFLQIYGGFALFSIAGYGTVNWGVAILTRQFAMPPGSVAQSLGTVFFFAGAIGALTIGQILDSRAVSQRRGAKLILLTALPLIMLPSAAMTLAPNGHIAIFAFALLIMISPMFSITMLRSLSELMPNDMRGLSVSLLSFAGTMIGGVCGPLLIALCTEHVLHDDAKVGQAVLIVAAPALIFSALCYAGARRSLLASVARSGGLAAIIAEDLCHEKEVSNP